MANLTRSGPPVRVLLVDDDDTHRHLLRLALAGSGLDVLEAASGARAVQMLADPRDRPDVIVMELMADGSGTVMIERVRLQPSTWDIPIVVLTGRVSEANKVRAIEAGADVFISKPFSPGRVERLLLRLAEEGRSALDTFEGESSWIVRRSA